MSNSQSVRSSDSVRGAFSSKEKPRANDLMQRVPPHSIEAEIAVLAAAMTNDPETVSNLVNILKSSEEFYDGRHKAIYEAILSLYSQNKPTTLTAINEQLHVLNLWDKAGGTSYLGEIAQAMISAAHGEYFAHLVRDRATQRRLIEACAKIINDSYPPAESLPALLDASEQAIFMIAQRLDQQNFEPIHVTIANIFDNMAKMSEMRQNFTGVTTGFARLDKLTSGLQPSDLIIVAARPSMGKTAFALSLAVNAALAGNSVAIFSLEMSRDQLVKRMLAIKALVDMGKFREPYRITDDDWRHLHAAADDLSRAAIYIDDTASLSTLEFKARVRRLKSKHDINLVIVDYLQLMHSPRGKDSRELEISDISRTLKAIAKDLNIPVMALSQLNRKVEERARDDKRPQLSDLRESGAIEQDADVIMFIYRDDVYKYKKPSERPIDGDAEIIIGKQRNGPTGVATLTYHSAYTAFVNKAEDREYGAMPSEV